MKTKLKKLYEIFSGSFHKLFIIAIYAAAASIACAGFSTHTKLDPEQPQSQTNSQNEEQHSLSGTGEGPTTSGDDQAFIPVRLHFMGWTYYEYERERIEKVFAAAGFRNDPAAGDLVQIYYEQIEVVGPLFRLVNAVGTIGTGTAIPFYDRAAYRLGFRYTNGDQVSVDSSYVVTNHFFISVFALPLTPFLWPPSQQRSSMAAAGADFARELRLLIDPTLNYNRSID